MFSDQMDTFQRLALGGSFEVLNLPPDPGDLFPPCNITDLTVNNGMFLVFTAPGDDLDIGIGELLSYISRWHAGELCPSNLSWQSSTSV